MQVANSAWKTRRKRKTSIRFFPAQISTVFGVQDDELREGGELVSRGWVEKREAGRGSYKREDAGGRGAGWLRKGFGFKRSPPPETRPQRHGRAWVGLWACVGCGLCGLDAVGPASSWFLWRAGCAGRLAGGRVCWRALQCWQPGKPQAQASRRRKRGTGHLWALDIGRPE